jgi:hypothetical protein
LGPGILIGCPGPRRRGGIDEREIRERVAGDISTGMLLGVPKEFIVRVEEFHYSEGEGDIETQKILQEEERHIKRVLSEHSIVLSEAAWNTVFSYAVRDVDPFEASGRLSEDEVRSVEEAFDALGLDP